MALTSEYFCCGLGFQNNLTPSFQKSVTDLEIVSSHEVMDRILLTEESKSADRLKKKSNESKQEEIPAAITVHRIQSNRSLIENVTSVLPMIED